MEYSEWFYPGGMAVNRVIHPGIIEQELSNIPSTNGQKTLDNPTIRVTEIHGISQANLMIHPWTKGSLLNILTLWCQGNSLTLSNVNEANTNCNSKWLMVSRKESNFC